MNLRPTWGAGALAVGPAAHPKPADQCSLPGIADGQFSDVLADNVVDRRAFASSRRSAAAKS